MITELTPKQVFVFGSNLAGNHAGGAAKQAYEQFGARMGMGEGLIGQSYAFPTLNFEMGKMTYDELLRGCNNLYFCCKTNPDKEFLLTKVGTGIAGYGEEYMKDLFKGLYPSNLILPEDWK